jgi:hypothetical protein
MPARIQHHHSQRQHARRAASRQRDIGNLIGGCQRQIHREVLYVVILGTHHILSMHD